MASRIHLAAIGQFLSRQFGRPVRFKIVEISDTLVCAELVYPRIYRGLRVGVPRSVIQKAELSPHLEGGG